jgi:hypothetical protein
MQAEKEVYLKMIDDIESQYLKRDGVRLQDVS